MLRLDGDELRQGLCRDLGFSAEDRAENVRRAGEVACLVAGAGGITVVALISPYAADRAAVRARHAEQGARFLEVHVCTSAEVCEERDPKGMWARARAGDLPGFTGVDDPYEPPPRPSCPWGPGRRLRRRRARCWPGWARRALPRPGRRAAGYPPSSRAARGPRRGR